MILQVAKSLKISWERDNFLIRHLERWLEERKSEGFSPRFNDLLITLLLVALALGMRFWDLGSRAFHHDESLHAYFSWFLYTTGEFKHNPLMHGPFQFEATAILFRIFGDSDFTARLLYVVFGAVLVFLPFFFRKWLGRIGALAASVLLVFSPALLYYSRFARNDILMAVWAFGLIIAMWRYFDEGKNRYLYIAAGLLAFMFATKESAYLVLVTLVGYLLLTLFWSACQRVSPQLDIEGLSPPAAFCRLVSTFWKETLGNGLSFNGLTRPAIFLLVICSVTLPQWSGALSILQKATFWPQSLVLAVQDGSAAGPVGAPLGGGLVIAYVTVIGLMVISVLVGCRWRCSVWMRCAAVFYGIWILLYTTFFTHWFGLGSGMWQGLSYWIVQQDVARGDQPWYYYFVITPIYEFLPMMFSLVASVYYIRRKDRLGIFLAFWVFVTFILYSIAAEKMPWLLVNVALPMIIMSGKFVGDIFRRFTWEDFKSPDLLTVLVVVPLQLILLWRLALSGTGGVHESATLLLAVGLVIIGLFVLIAFLWRRIGGSTFAALAVIPIVIILFVFTVKTGLRASYENGDIPVEMLVYVQSTSEIPRLTAAIHREGELEGDRYVVPVTIDLESGFQWPWAWYLRDQRDVSYPLLGGDTDERPKKLDGEIVLVHHMNDHRISPMLQEDFQQNQRFRFRWWFPEDTYRGLTLRKFLTSFGDRESWRGAMDYFLHRKDMLRRVGSEDGILYLSRDFETGFTVMSNPD